jgi:hypothetical protein
MSTISEPPISFSDPYERLMDGIDGRAIAALAALWVFSRKPAS